MSLLNDDQEFLIDGLSFRFPDISTAFRHVGDSMEDGSVVRVEYALFDADSDALIETNKESIAKDHERYEENHNYAPMLVVIGSGRLIEGFDEHLSSAEVGQSQSIIIPPEKGYGVSDSELIKTISLDKLAAQNRDVEHVGIGSPIYVDGRVGTLTFVAAGRARVDFNHPLAGKTLKYEYEVVELIEEETSRLTALLEAESNHSGFEVEIADGEASITLPPAVRYDHNWSSVKPRIINLLREHLDASRIVLREVYETPTASAQDEEE